MSVDEIIRSLRYEPQEWQLESVYLLNKKFVFLVHNKGTHLNGAYLKHLNIDRLRLRYAIWRWCLSQAKR